MMFQSYKKTKSDDKNINILQSAISEIMENILSKEITNGKIIKNISITASQLTINHGLEREPLGYVVIQKSADVNIWDHQLTNNAKKRTLILEADGSATISIWVF